ncbi:MAG TPA: YitT family protein [Candidatus Limiplasma sp.]|nr:YitT family protein [Candidatus Limiplasma sp.]HPS81541.1 YitT family protein [Candidatus Limiplasma sp.]
MDSRTQPSAVNSAGKSQTVKKSTGRDYTLLTLGSLLIALGVYFFKFPNHFSTGGVSGISIILNHYLPGMSPGTFMFVINQLLLVVGFMIFGRGFGFRTAYCSLVMSGATWALEYIVPMSAPLTTQPLLELIFAVTLPAIGSAILFNLQSSSGGTDVVAMILRKYTSWNIGVSLLCSDFVITAMACVAFGMETGLFSILGLMIKSVVVDMVLENINVHKSFQIITSTPEPIVRFIVEVLHRGATNIHGEGAFSHQDKTIILTVVNRMQAVKLRQYAKATDPGCFILIANTGEIIGKGFRGTSL